MAINLSALVLLVLGGLTLTSGDIFFKYWLEHHSSHLYIAGFVCYAAGLFFLIESYRFENIAVASAMLILFNLLTLTLVTWLYFHEPPNTLALVGLALGAVAVVLLELS